jgi:hypothetical protein
MYIISASTRACSSQGQGKDVSSYVGGGGEHVFDNMDILHIVSIKTIPQRRGFSVLVDGFAEASGGCTVKGHGPDCKEKLGFQSGGIPGDQGVLR